MIAICRLPVSSGCLVFASLLAGVIGVVFAPTAGAQQERSELRYLLEVRARQVELQEVRTRLERVRELHEEGLVSVTELENADAALQRAEINYQDALLSLLSVRPRISVQDAVKLEKSDGRRWVRLTLVNLTPQIDAAQLSMLADFEGARPLPETFTSRTVRDVFVSLKDAGGTNALGEDRLPGVTVALPYEMHVDELAYRQTKVLDFLLLRDIDSVVVEIGLKGQQRELHVQLRQMDGQRPLTIAANQISQEGDFGGEVTYDLQLERANSDHTSFALVLLDLPQGIDYSFVEPSTEARLSQINYPIGVSSRPLKLTLFLPPRPTADVEVDAPIEFQVAAAPPGQVEALRASASAPDRLEPPVGTRRLQVTPRGRGRIEVDLASLYTEVEKGQTVEAQLLVRNVGTRRLDGIEVELDLPPSWRAEVEPGVVPVLGIGDEKTVLLRVTPPTQVDVGDYEMRIRTKSFAYNRPVPTEEKVLRVTVQSGSRNVMAMGILASLVVLTAGIVVGGVKLTRR